MRGHLVSFAVAPGAKAMPRDLMTRGFRSCWGPGGRAGALWTLSVLLIYLGFRAALENSLSRLPADDLEHGVSISERRARLYDQMASDLTEHGAAFLRGGETSQSLSLSDIFSVKDGLVTPLLKPANPPVRANVLYLEPEFAVHISEAVRDVFLPYFEKAIWFQNTSVYHFSMFHASHHLTPVHASDVEVISGSDPLVIRTRLKEALPRAPDKQLYNPVMLHTSFARLLGHPRIPFEKRSSANLLQFFHQLAAKVNKKIRGFKASVSELWFVEEYDVLALALNGRMRTRRGNLSCLGLNR